jgi:hypothetical protein
MPPAAKMRIAEKPKSKLTRNKPGAKSPKMTPTQKQFPLNRAASRKQIHISTISRRYIIFGLALIWSLRVHPIQSASNSALELGTVGFALTCTSVAILSVSVLNRSASTIENIQVTRAAYRHL